MFNNILFYTLNEKPEPVEERLAFLKRMDKIFDKYHADKAAEEMTEKLPEKRVLLEINGKEATIEVRKGMRKDRTLIKWMIGEFPGQIPGIPQLKYFCCAYDPIDFHFLCYKNPDKNEYTVPLSQSMALDATQWAIIVAKRMAQIYKAALYINLIRCDIGDFADNMVIEEVKVCSRLEITRHLEPRKAEDDQGNIQFLLENLTVLNYLKINGSPKFDMPRCMMNPNAFCLKMAGIQIELDINDAPQDMDSIISLPFKNMKIYNKNFELENLNTFLLKWMNGEMPTVRAIHFVCKNTSLQDLSKLKRIKMIDNKRWNYLARGHYYYWPNAPNDDDSESVIIDCLENSVDIVRPSDQMRATVKNEDNNGVYFLVWRQESNDNVDMHAIEEILDKTEVKNGKCVF